eukprot:442458-Karenia_brevis.AAC.1
MKSDGSHAFTRTIANDFDKLAFSPQGDLFPLPHMTVPVCSDVCGRGLRQRILRKRRCVLQANHVIDSINTLYGVGHANSQ